MLYGSPLPDMTQLVLTEHQLGATLAYRGWLSHPALCTAHSTGHMLKAAPYCIIHHSSQLLIPYHTIPTTPHSTCRAKHRRTNAQHRLQSACGRRSLQQVGHVVEGVWVGATFGVQRLALTTGCALFPSQAHRWSHTFRLMLIKRCCSTGEHLFPAYSTSIVGVSHTNLAHCGSCWVPCYSRQPCPPCCAPPTTTLHHRQQRRQAHRKPRHHRRRLHIRCSCRSAQ